MAALEGNNMKDLLLYIARNLVENPDAVSVTEVEKDGRTTEDGNWGCAFGRQHG